MKKVLIIAEVFYPEEFLINDLAQEWIKSGYIVEVLTRVPSYPQGIVYSGYKNRIYQVEHLHNIKIHRFPVVQGYQKSKWTKIINYFSFIFWGSMIGLIIGNNFKNIFIYQTGPLTVALPGIFMKKIYGSKVTIWTQDLWPDTVYAYGIKKQKLLEYFLDILVKFVYKNSDHILVSCEGFKKKITKYIPNKKPVWVPNWSLLKNELSDRPVRLEGKFNFTFAGNIGKVQNLENVISAFDYISRKYSGVYLNILGDGSNLEKLKQIVNGNIIRNVVFHGRKPLIDMPAYFNASDVLIISLVKAEVYKLMIPSKFQAYVESGKPIFCIIDGELKELVLKYGVGKTALPDNVKNIQNTLEEFVNEDPEDLLTMGENAKKLSTTLFKRENIISKINDLVFESY